MKTYIILNSHTLQLPKEVPTFKVESHHETEFLDLQSMTKTFIETQYCFPFVFYSVNSK